MKHFVRTQRSVADHYVKHWSIIVNDGDMDFEFQNYHIPLWNTREVPEFVNWFRKLRTIQIDMLFNKIYNKVKIQNQNKWFKMWSTSNCVNFSRRNPKRNAQCVDHSGIPVYSTVRAGISCMRKDTTCEKIVVGQKCPTPHTKKNIFERKTVKNAEWRVEEYQDDNIMRVIRGWRARKTPWSSVTCDIEMCAVNNEKLWPVRVFCSHSKK